MKPYTRTHPEREFPAEVRKQERQAAKNTCRICGIPRDLGQLQSAHIYTHSQHPKWERTGGDPKKWKSDKYVSSFDNCVLLCKSCHGKVDSVKGLEICTVQYLESLKEDTSKCTALIKSCEGVRRCRKTNKGTKGTGYRCHLHLEGGLESKLEPRVWGGGTRKSTFKQQVTPEKSTCSIL